MLNFIKRLAFEAGKISLDEFERLGADDVHFKNDKDLVTLADRKVEEFIISEVRRLYPEHDIFAEETGSLAQGSEYCWVIDPIDGTTSFLHGQPFYSISIALQKNGETIACAVNAPRLGEMFYAEKGSGAFLGDKRLRVSERDRLINSVLATGFACVRAGLPQNNLPVFGRIVPKIRGVRRYGSAAIDLAYVAAGRLEGFWEMNLQPYDIAAGILLVVEAGGKVCDFNGDNHFPGNGTVATNGKITEEFMRILKG